MFPDEGQFRCLDICIAIFLVPALFVLLGRCEEWVKNFYQKVKK